MILCVNANAAIDKTVVVDRLQLNAIHRPENVLALPGGKGANVARVLRLLGESALVTGWIGGYAGRFIESGLRKEGIACAFVTGEAESRTCLSIVDRTTGGVTEIYEPGAAIPPPRVEALKDLFGRIVGRYTLVTLSGSLPHGVPDDFYAALIRMAREAGVRSFLDSSGQALEAGMRAGPSLIKPNRAEFRRLVGAEAAGENALAGAATAVAAHSGATVLLSLGAEGALLADGDKVWQARPPDVAATSAVGSGDSLLAGVAYARVRGLELPAALTYGVAAGTANTLVLGAGRLRLADFESILPQVAVRRLS